MVVFIQNVVKTLFLEINAFKAAFIPSFFNCTHVNQFSYKDQVFRNVGSRFFNQSRHLYGAGHICNPFSEPQSFPSQFARCSYRLHFSASLVFSLSKMIWY